MNRKQKIIVSITGIFIVLLALVGLTYAYFVTLVDGNKKDTSISVRTEKLELAYGDGNGVINAQNIEPGKPITFLDAQGNVQEYKTFTIENTGNGVTEYSVVFDMVDNEFVYTEDLQWQLEKLVDGSYQVVSSGFIKNLLSNSYQKQFLYASESIEPGIIDSYRLKLEYVDSGIDQSEDMGKNLSVRLNIAERTVNSRHIEADLAYQQYIITQRQQKNTVIDETALLNSIKTTLSSKNYETDDVILHNGEVLTGNVAEAFTTTTMKVGDKINYTSPIDLGEETWYILGIGEEGNLIITHDLKQQAYPTSRLSIKDYLEGKTQLDEYALNFIDGAIGVNARSITIEDINKVTGYNPNNEGVKGADLSVGTKYKEGTLREHKNVVTFTSSGDHISAVGTNGTISNSNTVTYFYPYNSTTPLNVGESYTVIRNYYSYYPETLTGTAYVSGNPVVGIDSSSNLYKMLFDVEKGETDAFGYWIASPYIDAKPTEAQWGLRTFDLSAKRITGNHFWNSTRGFVDYIDNGYVKAVVSIANDPQVKFTLASTDENGVNTFNIEIINQG